MKNRVRKVTPKKFHTARLRFRQIRPRQNRFGHVRVPKIGFAKTSSRQIRAGKLGFAKVGGFEVGTGKNSSREINALEVGVGKVGASQVGACASFFAAEKARVRFENVGEAFAFVLNALRFSQSHGLLSTPYSNAFILPAWQHADEGIPNLHRSNSGFKSEPQIHFELQLRKKRGQSARFMIAF